LNETDDRTSGPLPAQYQPPADLLAGRVILVTGATGGIGGAAATAFAAHGATVVLMGRRVPALTALYDRIVAAGGPEPAIYPLDLATAGPDDHAMVAASIGQQLGGLHGLLHCAARLGHLTPVALYDPVEWLTTVHVNVNAAFLLSQSCLPLLAASGDGRILFSAADVGRRGRAYWGAYAASKFAVEGLMQTLADEVEHEGRVRVNSVDPGPVRTRLRLAAFPAEPAGRARDPATVIPAYLYLMGPDARHLHGRALTVPAGGP
jgi:NAD(P)-dependent dehydrogenase (short-subunit alcohol dehydrogenase family)